jgi:Rrf2 family protein
VLTRTTETGIQVLLYLAMRRRREPASPRAMARALGQSPTYLSKVTGQLVRSGILAGHKGVKGGVTLARPPAALRLLDVVEALQGPVAGSEWHGVAGHPCPCAFHRAMADVATVTLEALGRWSVADMAVNPAGGGRLSADCLTAPVRRAVRAEKSMDRGAGRGAVVIVASIVLAAGTAWGGGPSPDPGAASFVNRCAGCHSLDGTKLSGPSLAPVAGWTDEALKPAILKMENRVGPIAPADLDSLAAFLRSGEARVRAEAEAERIRAAFAVTLAPPDAALGARHFDGRARLANGGLACVACHGVDGGPGRLGPDLAGAAVRLGPTALTSGIENSAYRVMAAHYRRHPITKQEAAHLTAYLATVPVPEPGTAARPSHGLALGGVFLAFAGLAVYYDRRRRPRAGATRRGRG